MTKIIIFSNLLIIFYLIGDRGCGVVLICAINMILITVMANVVYAESYDRYCYLNGPFNVIYNSSSYDLYPTNLQFCYNFYYNFIINN